MGAVNADIVTMLREVRQRAEVTQEVLADAIGVSRQTIISIERETMCHRWHWHCGSHTFLK